MIAVDNDKLVMECGVAHKGALYDRASQWLVALSFQ